MKNFVATLVAWGPPGLLLLAARIARYFTLAYLGSQLGDGAGAYLKSHAWNIGGILALLFALLFGCVKVMDYRRARLSPTA